MKENALEGHLCCFQLIQRIFHLVSDSLVKRKEERVDLVVNSYSPKMCLNIGNAFGNRSNSHSKR